MTKAEATEAAQALKKRMKGRGWKIRVWDNIGWHFAVQNGPLNVHQCGDKYSCLLGDGVSGCGLWHSAHDGCFDPDPNKVVRVTIERAKQCLAGHNDEHQKIVDAAILATGSEVEQAMVLARQAITEANGDLNNPDKVTWLAERVLGITHPLTQKLKKAIQDSHRKR
jgi:hypothetical protein